MNIRKRFQSAALFEPLAEVACLWGGATDTTSGVQGEEVLLTCPLSQKVNKSFLVAFLERELIIAVNEAGSTSMRRFKIRTATLSCRLCVVWGKSRRMTWWARLRSWEEGWCLAR